MVENDKCWCAYKKRHACEKDYIWSSVTYSCENGKYLASIADDSAISCDEFIEPYDEETKTVAAGFDAMKATWKK